MKDADYFTYQFYTWEYRGRGIEVSEYPVHLEAPFIPFFRHKAKDSYIDDGKRHTLFSSLIETIKGAASAPTIEQGELDYQTLEPFAYNTEGVLTALQVRFSKDRKVTVERMKALFIVLSSYNPAIISFEIIGTEDSIITQFVSVDSTVALIETYVSAYFPDALLQYSNNYLYSIVPQEGFAAIHDLALQQEFFRPIHAAKNFNLDPLIGVFAMLDRLGEGEQGIVQILFQSTGNTWPESIMQSVTAGDGTSFFINDPTAPKLALEKTRSPLFAVTVRTIGVADDIDRAIGIAEQLCRAISIGTKSDYNQLVPPSSETYDFVTRMLDVQFRESHRLGMLLNTDELISLVHFPSENIKTSKLHTTTRKTVAVPAIATNKEFVVGENQHNGSTETVTVSKEDRVKHTHIIGATGTGKSTLIANLISQDIAKGYSVVVFDPHGDLVTDIVARVPQHRLHDVVLIDPSDVEFPIGLNLLQAHTDVEREILSSDLVASFRRFATSWGDQMNAVFGNAIQAILEHKQGGTLHDVRRFLIEKEFRQSYLRHVTDPSVLYYWYKEFPLLKSNSIGPILTRLDSFLRPKSIRNMVIQSKTIDFETLLSNNKIILLKLPQGLIGMENSFVLGSLLLSKIHQALFRRQQHSVRNPVFLYLDEFQNFITPSIKDMLSGIRKYNAGLTLSHQDLQQLQREDAELLNSVLSNTNNRIVFRLGEPDAKVLQNSFVHFEAPDLQNLSRGEAAISIEQPQYDCSLTTLPLPKVSNEERLQKLAAVTSFSRTVYATPRQEVEQKLYESLNIKAPPEELKKDKVDAQSSKPKEPPIVSKSNESTQILKEELHVGGLQTVNEDNSSTHRYLQTLVKKMAEARGYTAGLEIQLPDGSGQVDVLLSKEGKTIAIEICNTTEAMWEMHNISKCLKADYDMVISLSGDLKQLEKIRKKCIAEIADFEQKPVKFFTPDALFYFLNESLQKNKPQEKVMKGYRVNVSYDTTDGKESTNKRASVAQIVLNSLKKKR